MDCSNAQTGVTLSCIANLQTNIITISDYFISSGTTSA